MDEVYSQISIITANFTTFNVSPSALCDIQVMNGKSVSVEIVVESKLYNSNNEALLSVKSNTLVLKPGLNSLLNNNITYSYVDYGSNNAAQYIKTTKTLPPGRYRYCSVVTVINNAESGQDEYCDELEAESNNLLYLVSVADKEEIETPYPVLIWNHSEPFNLLAANEFYRLVLVEMGKDQTPDAAVTINQPMYVKNFLTTHSIQYPVDAKKLETQKSYAWQVQKMSNGVVIDKTEAWEFKLKESPKLISQKYVYLKENLDASAYQCIDGHVYFIFKENYSGNNLNVHLFDEDHKEVEIIKPKIDRKNSEEIKSHGSNYYDLNLEMSKLKAGIYFLEVSNEKGEVRKLKIKIQK